MNTSISINIAEEEKKTNYNNEVELKQVGAS